MSAEPAPGSMPGARQGLSVIDLLLILLIVVWGFGYVPFVTGQREIPTALFNSLRYVIVAPAFWVMLLASGEDWRLPRALWGRATAAGLIGVLLYSVAFSVAARLSTSANVSLLLALSPVWAVIMQWALGKGRPTLRFAAGSTIAFAGAAAVIASGSARLGFSPASLRGDLIGMAASILWAWYGIVAQPLLKGNSGIKVQAWINTIALVGFALWQMPVALQFDWGAVTAIGWWSVVYVGLAVSVFGHYVWYTGIAKVGPHRVYLAMYLIPVLAAGAGAIFLGQPFGFGQLLGAAVALAGVAVVRSSAA